MTEIRPFPALRYNTNRVDLSKVVVPPYDVLTPEDRVMFYERDPHNAIRLELTKDVKDEASTDYSEVRATLDAWKKAGILTQDEKPCLYGLRQTFVSPDGQSYTREGFFAALKLEDYEQRIVRPHERTLAGPKADRLKILRATRANLSSVFFLYEDQEFVLESRLAAVFAKTPDAVATDQAGIEHALFVVRDESLITEVCRFLAARPVVIADGHHRYETALNYRNEQRATHGGTRSEAPYEFTLGYFTNAFGSGNLLLPIHRVILQGEVPSEATWCERLPGWQQKTVAIGDVAQIGKVLEENLAPLSDQHAFAADDGSGTLRIFWRAASDEALTIRVIHAEVVEGVFGLSPEAVRDGAVAYPKSAERAAFEVRQGAGVVTLYLNPLHPGDVFEVTGRGEILPQKSTFYLPKLPSGLVFREQADT